MTKEQICQLIRILENVRLRPGMYAWGLEALLTTWMSSFDCGLYIVKGEDREHCDKEAYLKALKKRGWPEGLSNLSGYIKSKGFSDDEVHNEQLIINIEAWKNHLATIEDIEQNAPRREEVSKIIQMLETVRQKPDEYIHGETYFAPVTYLSGLHEGLMLFGAIQDQAHVPLFDQVKSERGWAEDTPDFFHYLKNERGFSNEEATTELLTIEIEAWKKRLAAIEAQEAAE